MKYDLSTATNWLPTFPQVALQVLEIFSNEEFTLVELVKTIKTDPALTASILKVANSPLYRARKEISTLEHAISWLGKKEVGALVLSFKLADFGDKNEAIKNQFSKFWSQSFVHGVAMDCLGELGHEINRSEAYIAGILMDIGRLLLLNSYPDGYLRLIEKSVTENRDLYLIEQESIGISHADISGDIIEGMGLPKRFAEVARFHTLDLAQLDQLDEHPDRPLILAGIATAATGDFYCHNIQGRSLAAIEKVLVEKFQLGNADLQWYFNTVRERVEQKADLFKINLNDVPPTSLLLGRAAEHLAASESAVPHAPAAGEAHAAPASDNGLNHEFRLHLQLENQRLRVSIRELENRVCRDPLTQAFNREYFTGRFEQRIMQNFCSGDAIGLMVMDLDRFKLINDELGHLTGDQAIVVASRIIREAVPETAVVARYGGDEFVVLFTEGNEQAFRNAADKICRDMSGRSASEHGLPRSLTVSVGGAFGKIGEMSSNLAAQIFQLADSALYYVKRRGGSAAHIRPLVELAEVAAEESRFEPSASPPLSPPAELDITEAVRALGTDLTCS